MRNTEGSFKKCGPSHPPTKPHPILLFIKCPEKKAFSIPKSSPTSSASEFSRIGCIQPKELAAEMGAWAPQHSPSLKSGL